ncbi:hypothetical protein [Psychroflexus torquis]|nr:hypothetical protein [Psychroflexus torquis]
MFTKKATYKSFLRASKSFKERSDDKYAKPVKTTLNKDNRSDYFKR